MESGDPIARLLGRWREDTNVLRRHGLDRRADWLAEIVDEIEDAVQCRRSELVTIAEAAEVSDYSRKHLRRLVRDGRLRAERPNGDGGCILIRRSDLPRKPTAPREADDDPISRHLQKLNGGQ